MNDNELLLLGLLQSQSQHGYQINEFIENNLSHVTDIKKGNAYATLDRLAKQGYVAVQSEQEGNRPPRKVYSTTAAGQTYFAELLQANLVTADRMTLGGNIGLLLIDYLPPATAANYLGQRLQQIREQVAAHHDLPKHGHGIGVDLITERYLALLAADVAWLEGTIERLNLLAEST